MNRSKTWLDAEFAKRRKKNPAFSLRSFSKFLQIPSGRLSEIMSGKRRLTMALGKKIADRLGFDPTERNAFLESIVSDNKERAATSVDERHFELATDTFDVIADWEHFAILSLMDTKPFQPDAKWIARRLGISATEARAALERLVRVGLLKVDENRMTKIHKEVKTSDEVASAALRKAHTQSLQRTIEMLESIPISERDITSTTLAIDIQKLPIAKKLIRDFRRKLAAVLETGATNEVYELNIQLIPLTKKEILK